MDRASKNHNMMNRRSWCLRNRLAIAVSLLFFPCACKGEALHEHSEMMRRALIQSERSIDADAILVSEAANEKKGTAALTEGDAREDDKDYETLTQPPFLESEEKLQVEPLLEEREAEKLQTKGQTGNFYRFILRHIGNCNCEACRFIRSKKECRLGAHILNLTDPYPDVISESSSPVGCYYASGKLWFNLSGNQHSQETAFHSICTTTFPYPAKLIEEAHRRRSTRRNQHVLKFAAPDK